MNSTGGKHLDGKGFNATQTLTLLPPLKGMNNMLPPDFIQQHTARKIENAEFSYHANNYVVTHKMQSREFNIDGITSQHIKKIYNFQSDMTEEVIAFARKDGIGYVVDLLNNTIISTIEKSKSDESLLAKWDENFMLVNGQELYEVYRDGRAELRTILVGGEQWKKIEGVEIQNEYLNLGLPANRPINQSRGALSSYSWRVGNKIYFSTRTSIECFDIASKLHLTVLKETTLPYIGVVTYGDGVCYLVQGMDIYTVSLETGTKTKIATLPSSVDQQAGFPSILKPDNPPDFVRAVSAVYHDGYVYTFCVETHAPNPTYAGDIYRQLKECYKVNVVSKQVSRIADIPQYKLGMTAIVLQGKIHLLGGLFYASSNNIWQPVDGVVTASKDVYVYDTEKNTYEKQDDLAYPASLIGATVYDDRLYYTGGVDLNGTGKLENMYIYPGNILVNITGTPSHLSYGYIPPPVIASVDKTIYILRTNDGSVASWNIPTAMRTAKALLIKDGRVVISQGDTLYYSGVGDSNLWNESVSDTDDGGLFLQVGYKEKSDIIHAIICAGNIVVWKDNGCIYVVKGSYPDWQVLRLAENEFLTTNTVSVGGEVIYGTETGLKKLSTTSAYGDYVVSRFQNEIKDLNAIYLHVSKVRNSLLVSTLEQMYEFNIDLQAWYSLGKDKGNLTSFTTYRNNTHGNIILGIKEEGLQKGVYSTAWQSDIQLNRDFHDFYTISFARELASGRVLIKRVVLYCLTGADKTYRDEHPVIMYTHGRDLMTTYKRRQMRFVAEDRCRNNTDAYKIIKNQILICEAFQPEFEIPRDLTVDKIEISYVEIGNQ